MPVAAIREIRNNSDFVAKVRNLEPSGVRDTADGRGDLTPGESKDLNIWIPFCDDGNDFDKRHIVVDVLVDALHVRRFLIWQATHEDGSRVRVSTDGAWHNPGDQIGGFTAEGWAEWALGGGDRTLVVNESSLWLLPRPLVKVLEDAAKQAAEEGYRICDQNADQQVPSVPKKSSVAFSMAGIPSDAHDRGEQGTRFLYRDSGKRYEFEIRDGVVHFQPPVLGKDKLDRVVSFERTRTPKELPAPQFDLIASSGGRVFAKEKDRDRFYFAILDNMFIHPGKDNREFVVPSSYFKLDPEFNQQGASTADLTAPLTGDFAGHPVAATFPAYRLALGLNLLDWMVARVQRGKWHLLDVRPPVINPLALLPLPLLKDAPLFGLSLGWLVWWAPLIQLEVEAQSIPKVQDVSPPDKNWAPTYDHVCYCPRAGAPVWQRSIQYRRVLDIGVGHVHLHEQYERITGGEIQPLRTSPISPKFEDNPAEMYRFLNGPVRDGDGYIDGTCNYYALVQLKTDDEITKARTTRDRRDAYAILYTDEQSYFAQRWRLVHPDDFHGLSSALVAQLQQDQKKAPPRRYNWDPQTYWCPFRAGHIGAKSRLAVAAQVLLVTGGDPPDGEAAVIYSINYSWSTIDRTWRWRKLPPKAQYFADEAAARDETITIPKDGDDCVYPQTIRLRGDMTIHLKGTRRKPEGVGVEQEVGRWYQRYLPVTNQHVPKDLVAATEPDPPGCAALQAEIKELEGSKDGLDPRLDHGELVRINRKIRALERQAKELGCGTGTPAPPAIGYTHHWKFLPEPVFRLADRFSHFGVYDSVNSRTQYYLIEPASEHDAQVLAAAAGESGPWVDERHQLAISTYTFQWDWLRIPWPPFPPPPLQLKIDPSLYNPDTRLRIVKRGSFGWIAMLWDKRDDDLMPFGPLIPSPVVLKNGTATAHVWLRSNIWTEEPPIVHDVVFFWQSDPQFPAALMFCTPQDQRDFDRDPERKALLSQNVDKLVFENVWRVRMAALDPDQNGAVVSLLDLVTEERFRPIGPGQDGFYYLCNLKANEVAGLTRYCTREGAIKYGTSIWFEDIVGHVSVSEEVGWPPPRPPPQPPPDVPAHVEPPAPPVQPLPSSNVEFPVRSNWSGYIVLPQAPQEVLSGPLPPPGDWRVHWGGTNWPDPPDGPNNQGTEWGPTNDPGLPQEPYNQGPHTGYSPAPPRFNMSYAPRTTYRFIAKLQIDCSRNTITGELSFVSIDDASNPYKLAVRGNVSGRQIKFQTPAAPEGIPPFYQGHVDESYRKIDGYWYNQLGSQTGAFLLSRTAYLLGATDGGSLTINGPAVWVNLTQEKQEMVELAFGGTAGQIVVLTCRATDFDNTPGFIRAAISDSSGNDLDSHTVSSPEEEIHITVGPLPDTASYRVYVSSNITVTLSLNLSEP
jgi:hypothetical protein